MGTDADSRQRSLELEEGTGPLVALQGLRLYLRRPPGQSQRLGEEAGCESTGPRWVSLSPQTRTGSSSRRMPADFCLLQHLAQISALIKPGWGCKSGQQSGNVNDKAPSRMPLKEWC